MGDVIKEIHRSLLEIYIEMKKICMDNGLKMFLAGGSAIGAARHHGFIPWDDDMDVLLPREHYIKFVQIASEYLPPHMKLVHFERENIYVIEDHRFPIKKNKLYRGSSGEFVRIDIQPLDGIPDNNLLRKLHCLKTLFSRGAYRLCDIDRVTMGDFRKKWEIVAISIIKYSPIKFRNREKWKRKWDYYAQKYPYDSHKWVADFYGKYNFRDVYPKEWWEPGIVMSFEGIKALAPSQYDKYLTKVYGDYMTIPEEKDTHYICQT